MIPIRTDRKLRHPPLVNYMLILANVAVFVVFQHAQGDLPAARPFLLHPDMPQVNQFFTCMFMHNDWTHLIGNMLFLWVFGNAVNDSFGSVGYLAFYLAGGVFAGVGYVLLSGAAPVLGASGAISAVTGAFLVLFPRVRVTLLLLLPFLLMPLEIPSLIFLLLQFVWNLYASFKTSPGSAVAYAAHASGYLFGIIVAAPLLAVRLLPRDGYDLLSMFGTWRQRQAYRHAALAGHESHGSGGGARRWVQAQTLSSQPAGSDSAAELALRQQISADHARGLLESAANNYLKLLQVSDQAVLPQNQQLDVANYFMSAGLHSAAADAYERFLANYPNYEFSGDIRLMLGLIYGRYLHQYDKAQECLAQALPELRDAGKAEMARQELERLRHNR
jgi:membrane associated rhomboid family serine protease